MIRATLESLAENASDAIVAPLMYLVIAGPVGAIVYKAINTLDSMIGYRNDRYLYFGRAAARLDDVANLLPSRITAGCLAIAALILNGRGRNAINACFSDASKHASPNAGWPEAAMAGALGVQLGGAALTKEKRRSAQLWAPTIAHRAWLIYEWRDRWCGCRRSSRSR